MFFWMVSWTKTGRFGVKAALFALFLNVVALNHDFLNDFRTLRKQNAGKPRLYGSLVWEVNIRLKVEPYSHWFLKKMRDFNFSVIKLLILRLLETSRWVVFTPWPSPKRCVFFLFFRGSGGLQNEMNMVRWCKDQADGQDFDMSDMAEIYHKLKSVKPFLEAPEVLGCTSVDKLLGHIRKQKTFLRRSLEPWCF